METVEVALALGIGFAIGMVVGALGAGGGILSVPVLVYLLGQDAHAASAGSLVIVGLTAVVSLVPQARAGHVRWRDGLVCGALSAVGTAVGSRLSVLVSGRVLMVLFGVLLVGVGVMMLRKAGSAGHGYGHGCGRHDRCAAGDARAGDPSVSAEHLGKHGHVGNHPSRRGSASMSHDRGSASTAAPVFTPRAQESSQSDGCRQRADQARTVEGARPAAKARGGMLLLVACASATGFLTGLFGVGGGFAVVPMLVLVLGFTMREASATSLLVMIIASAVGLLARVGTDVAVDWPVVAAFAAASMVGGLIGAPASRRVKENVLTAIFGVLLMAVALATLVSTVLS